MVSAALVVDSRSLGELAGGRRSSKATVLLSATKRPGA